LPERRIIEGAIDGNVSLSDRSDVIALPQTFLKLARATRFLVGRTNLLDRRC
jgi:hypothetical protein